MSHRDVGDEISAERVGDCRANESGIVASDKLNHGVRKRCACNAVMNYARDAACRGVTRSVRDLCNSLTSEDNKCDECEARGHVTHVIGQPGSW
jgi:hypothetical protein